MRTRSLKRRREIREFIPLAEVFLEENPDCQFPLGCSEPSEVVHHARGRFGRRLLDRTYWRASCNDHNNYAETNTGESLDCGWLVRIESVDGAA
jgi:hypothetical protein